MKFLRSYAVHIILGIAVCILFVFEFFIHAHKIAYVDSAKLMSGYKAMLNAKAEFEKKQTSWKSNIDTLTNDVQDAIKKFEKTAAAGSKTEQALAKQLINEKQKQLYDYQVAVKQSAGDEEQRLTQNVLATVNAYLMRYGKKHRFQVILVAANGNIAYADNALDITDVIVEELNNEYTTPVTSQR